MAIDKIGSKALVDCSVAAVDIAPGTITTTKLASTLDISSKTVTLPNTSVTNAMLAGSIANAKLANSSITVNGTAINLGASASLAPVAWQSVVVSDGSTVTTMVAGRGYFVNNTSAAGIVKLPAGGTAGDTIAIKDYAGNFATNKLTIQRNGHKIQGNTNDGLIQTNRASVQLVYIDATKGWLYTNESNVGNLENLGFISATGGTVSNSGNYRMHSFTGDSNFVVATAGLGPSAYTDVSYFVLGGGASGAGAYSGGGGGAGGFREGKQPSDPYSASPLAAAAGITVTAQTYPITVGAGGASGSCGAPQNAANNGSNSVFSTITSAGGGKGNAETTGGNGGSGGGGGGGPGASPGVSGGTGNTPPVSPPQGTNGGNGGGPGVSGGGGGGAGQAGSAFSGSTGGAGGNGLATSITASPVTRGGGGGGGSHNGGSGGTGGTGGGTSGSPSSTSQNHLGSSPANSGGGGGGSGGQSGNSPGGWGGNGGRGLVVIRYKYQ